MRYVILGAGAIGGAMGGKLAAAGSDVVLVARGAHLETLQKTGLTLCDPDSTETLRLPAVGSPAEAGIQAGDCVVVATKTQHTEGVLAALAAAATSNDVPLGEIAVVCAQNGVENERISLRRFPATYGMRVILAGTHLEPGVVEIATAPVFGVLDVGRFPTGTDSVAEEIVRDLVRAGFDARATADVMPFKYLKLLSNLGNSLEAASGTRLGNDTARAIFRAARAEARACFEAAGIAVADEGEDEVRRRMRGGPREVNGVTRQGGSSWQSLQRGTGDIEADYLNGEIALLGRLHGVPTPVNEFLQRLANQLATDRTPPGSVPIEDIAAQLPPGVLEETEPA